MTSEKQRRNPAWWRVGECVEFRMEQFWNGSNNMMWFYEEDRGAILYKIPLLHHKQKGDQVTSGACSEEQPYSECSRATCPSSLSPRIGGGGNWGGSPGDPLGAEPPLLRPPRARLAFAPQAQCSETVLTNSLIWSILIMQSSFT